MEHNRRNFGARLKSIIGNFKSIIGSGPHYCEWVYNVVLTVRNIVCMYRVTSWVKVICEFLVFGC